MCRSIYLVMVLVTLCLTACDEQSSPTFRSSTLDADASIDETPTSWEGDWTWEDPSPIVDQGLSHISCPADEGIANPSDDCVLHERFGNTIRLSVSSDLIAHCQAGHIIHLWDADGIEHLSQPDRTLTFDLPSSASGWIAFNVTCGSGWTQSMDWSSLSADDLIEHGLIAITSEDKNITPYLKLCSSVGGVLLPRFPLECGTDPCS